MKTCDKLTLLNSPILTVYGTFKYKNISLDAARRMIREAFEIESAIGHESTAEVLTRLLEYPIKQKRIEYKQRVGETALIFRLRSRPPEGRVLDEKELGRIGYEFGVLNRID